MSDVDPLSALVARRNARTIPIELVASAELARWKKKQKAAVRSFVEASGFAARSGSVVLVPGASGVACALAGKPGRGPWGWAQIAEHLPAGRYAIGAAEQLEPGEATEAAIGWALAAYRFDRYRSSPSPEAPELLWPSGADRARVASVVRAIAWARDLINTPAQDLGPAELAHEARALAALGAELRVVEVEAIEREYPAVHAVGRGASRPPRVIDARWGDPAHPRVTLVGKGVCFDTGGLDLKPADSMLRMKKDMGGAAIVLALSRLVIESKMKVRLRALIGAVENAIGPDAYRPLDVITTRKGLRVEVTHTDAEGRLVLADLLADADREEPELLIDVATLTGSARVALGPSIAAFFATDRKLADEISSAGRRGHDPVWRLPLHRPYRRYLESKVGDLRNTATTSLGGAITAAVFLAEFVERARAWAHFDVYGWNEGARAGRPLGGEATGLRAIHELLLERYG
ncbi:MAG: leucyl aminopeptidase family protein [Sandaracinaceae bacterium]|nr:leucyl aminopeptidase family protein [Sandaracinaceae bacterium]